MHVRLDVRDYGGANEAAVVVPLLCLGVAAVKHHFRAFIHRRLQPAISSLLAAKIAWVDDTWAGRGGGAAA